MYHRDGAWADDARLAGERLPVQNGTAQPDLSSRTTMSYRTAMFLEILMILMCLGAVTGNILVIVIVAATKTFRCVTSVLIINLAVSDLLVGVGVMPFVAVSIMNKSWVDFTNLCLYVGYTSSVYCTASVLTLAAIALDRYHAIMDCLRYGGRCTLRRTCWVVLWIWLQALLTSCPPLLGWSYVDYVVPMFICAVRWSNSASYTVFMAVLSFAMPAAVILFCYVNIVRVARGHARRIHTLEDQLQRNGRGGATLTHSSSSSSSSSSYLSTDSSSQKPPLVYHLSGRLVSEVRGGGATLSGSGQPDPGTAGPRASSSSSPSAPQRAAAVRPTAFGAAPSRPAAASHDPPLTPQGFSPPPSYATNAPRPPPHHHHPHHSHQGVVRLFLIIFAFLLCWTPYIGVALVQAAEAALSNRPSRVSPSAVTFSYWLALLNSDINPLLYALLSKRFQGALASLRQKLGARLGGAVGERGRGGGEDEEEGRSGGPTGCTVTHVNPPDPCPDPPGSNRGNPARGCSSIFIPGSASSSSSSASSCALWRKEEAVRVEGSTRRPDCLQVPSRTLEGSRLPFSAATRERQATFFYGQITVRVEHDVG